MHLGHLLEQLAALPVPHPEPTFGVARGDAAPVSGEAGLAREAGDDVPLERLLAVLAHAALAAEVRHQLVVHRLSDEGLAVRMHGDGGYGCHCWVYNQDSGGRGGQASAVVGIHCGRHVVTRSLRCDLE